MEETEHESHIYSWSIKYLEVENRQGFRDIKAWGDKEKEKEL